jgi:trimeric autotransporter adhesin
MKPLQYLFMGCFLFVFGVPVHAQPENDPTRWDWKMPRTSLDRQVLAITELDGKLIFGGHFNRPHDNPFINRVAQFDPVTGLWDAVVDVQLQENVHALATRNGKVIAAGNFTGTDPYWGDRVDIGAILQADPTSDSFEQFGAGIVGSIEALLVADDQLVVGGLITQAGGQATQNLAIWSWETQSWTPITESTVGHVRALARSGNRLYIGGDSGLSMWNLELNQWEIIDGLGSVNGPVRHVSIQDGSLYIAGGFTTIAGLEGETSAVRMNLTTQIWERLDIPGAMNVMIGAWGGNTWVISGLTDSVGVPYQIFEFNPAQNTWRAWTGGATESIKALYYFDQQWFVGGAFTRIGGRVTGYAAKYDPIQNTWSRLDAAFDGGVYALAASGPQLFVGGQFANIPGGIPSSGIASMNVEDGSVNGIGANSFTYSMHTVGSHLYVGGAFNSIAGLPARNAAALQISTDSWDAISTASSGTNNRVSSILSYEQDIIWGGTFTSIGGVNASNVARYSPSTRTWTSLGSVGEVRGMAVVGDTLFIAGSFTAANGVPARMIARRNMKTGTWSAVGDVSHAIQSIATDGRYVYVSGYFESIDSNSSLSGYARYDTQTGEWSPMPEGKPASFAYSFLKVGDYLYVGHFGVHRYHIPTEEWMALDGGPSTGGPVRAMANIGEYLYVGGEFREVGGSPASHLTRYLMPAAVLTSVEQDVETLLPARMELHANYPNPFNPSTQIRFTLNASEHARLTIYDVMGREITVLVNGTMPAGTHAVAFDASQLSSGVYLYQLQSAGEVLTRKMILLK